jgi:hypothetical protein
VQRAVRGTVVGDHGVAADTVGLDEHCSAVGSTAVRITVVGGVRRGGPGEQCRRGERETPDTGETSCDVHGDSDP